MAATLLEDVHVYEPTCGKVSVQMAHFLPYSQPTSVERNMVNRARRRPDSLAEG